MAQAVPGHLTGAVRGGAGAVPTAGPDPVPGAASTVSHRLLAAARCGLRRPCDLFESHRLVKTSNLRGTVHTSVAASSSAALDAVARTTGPDQVRNVLKLQAGHPEQLAAEIEAFTATTGSRARDRVARPGLAVRTRRCSWRCRRSGPALRQPHLGSQRAAPATAGHPLGEADRHLPPAGPQPPARPAADSDFDGLPWRTWSGSISAPTDRPSGEISPSSSAPAWARSTRR